MSSHDRFDPNYDIAPRIVIWEMTRACALACVHCRAEAIPFRDPRELTTSEAFALVDDIAACGNPMLVLTGGIGVNDIEARSEICTGLEFLGIVLDPARNNVRGASTISAPDSRSAAV